jgi:hypothetical protein
MNAPLCLFGAVDLADTVHKLDPRGDRSTRRSDKENQIDFYEAPSI